MGARVLQSEPAPLPPPPCTMKGSDKVASRLVRHVMLRCVSSEVGPTYLVARIWGCWPEHLGKYKVVKRSWVLGWRSLAEILCLSLKSCYYPSLSQGLNSDMSKPKTSRRRLGEKGAGSRWSSQS